LRRQNSILLLALAWTVAALQLHARDGEIRNGTVHEAGDSVAVTALVPDSCTTCGGDSLYEHAGVLGSAQAIAALTARVSTTAPARTIGARIMSGW